MSDLRPVISLLIRDKEHPKKVLIGVRSPDSNRFHPNVVSTITQRIPKCLEVALLRDLVLESVPAKLNFPEQVTKAYTIRDPLWSTSTGNEKEDENPLIFSVRSLMSCKLLPQKVFQARVKSVIDGNILYEQTGEEIGMRKITKDGTSFYEERLRMIGIEVLTENARLFPTSTHSYSALRWVDEEQFVKMVGHRDVSFVAEEIGDNAVMYCVKGLCLLSAYIPLIQEQKPENK